MTPFERAQKLKQSGASTQDIRETLVNDGVDLESMTELMGTLEPGQRELDMQPVISEVPQPVEAVQAPSRRSTAQTLGATIGLLMLFWAPLVRSTPGLNLILLIVGSGLVLQGLRRKNRR